MYAVGEVVIRCGTNNHKTNDNRSNHNSHSNYRLNLNNSHVRVTMVTVVTMDRLLSRETHRGIR